VNVDCSFKEQVMTAGYWNLSLPGAHSGRGWPSTSQTATIFLNIGELPEDDCGCVWRDENFECGVVVCDCRQEAEKEPLARRLSSVWSDDDG
jgi:hypothetical protein